MFKRRLGLIIIIWLLSFGYAEAAAWGNLRYEHFSQDEDLVALLMDFSSSINVPLVISNRVKTGIVEKVNGHFKGLTARGFLTKLASIYQIVWYYDGHILYVYHADEMLTELFQLERAKADNLRNTLKELGVFDERFNWKMMQDQNIIFISGPPRYIQLIREISILLERKFEKESVYTVKVFSLKYASATDREFNHRGQRIVVPGVATVLKSILGQNTKIALGDSEADLIAGLEDTGSGLPGLKGTGVNRNSQENGSSTSSRVLGQDLNPQPENTSNNARSGPSLANIEANAQNNTIIVHDLLERMDMYEELIKSFDNPIQQVEIEVSIVEINTDRLNDIGVDWRLRDKNGFFGFGDFQDVINDTTEGFSHNFTNDISNLSAILDGENTGEFFLGKIKMLSTEGEGQILSQPSVITMNNLEAIIDNSTTFFVKLEGEDEVDLVPVSVGSVLRVTPRIIKEGVLSKIMLNVSIEDGQSLDDTSNNVRVDDIPTVTKSVINTQAVIDERSSLLVGGFFFDQRTSQVQKMPLLGELPGLKYLFSNESKERRKIARLFLITPKIVDSIESYAQSEPVRRILEEHANFYESGYQTPDYPIFD